MKKRLVIGLILGGVALAALVFASLGPSAPSEAVAPDGASGASKAERIEVVHFHATQQCWSCVTVGEYALKTIKERFPDEYRDGTVVFRTVNGELPANRAAVIKYQARGSSLFINAVKDGQDNIGEDTMVWRLVNDERRFMDYLETRLKTLLGR